MALKGQGNRAEAESILTRLAPIDHPGYVPAHLEMARSLFNGRDRSPRALRALEMHLKIALDGSPFEAAEAGMMLGQFYAATGRGEQAERYLLKAVDHEPEYLLLLARLAHQRGNESLAQERAERATNIFRKQTEIRFDDSRARVLWATALVYRNDFAAAAGGLEQGMKLADIPLYRTTLGQVYAAWEADRAAHGEPATGERLALIERGLSYDPNNATLLDRLSLVLQGNDAAAESVQDEPSAPCLREGHRRDLTSSSATMPAVAARTRRPAATGNKPSSLTRKWPSLRTTWPGSCATPSLPTFPAPSSSSTRPSPDDPTIPDSEEPAGVVYMKLERNSKNALTDLEAELAAFPDRQGTHQALAEVYDHLGAPELATQHRTLANAPPKVAAPNR